MAIFQLVSCAIVLRFDHGFLVVFQAFSAVCLWFSNCFLMVSYGFSHGFPAVFLRFSYGFPIAFLWFPSGFPMVFICFAWAAATFPKATSSCPKSSAPAPRALAKFELSSGWALANLWLAPPGLHSIFGRPLAELQTSCNKSICQLGPFPAHWRHIKAFSRTDVALDHHRP